MLFIQFSSFGDETFIVTLLPEGVYKFCIVQKSIAGEGVVFATKINVALNASMK